MTKSDYDIITVDHWEKDTFSGEIYDEIKKMWKTLVKNYCKTQP